jgi:4-alpha-glucanotransferase
MLGAPPPRESGLLLHPTSLPGALGTGDLGAGARRFVDFLAAAGQRLWQVLPLGPTAFGDSPYSAESTFAGNPLLVDLAPLVEDGLLCEDDLGAPLPADHADYAAAAARKIPLLARAAAVFVGRAAGRAELDAFSASERAWLDDFALYTALKRAAGGAPWIAWDEGLAQRRPEALGRAARELAPEITAVRFEQLAFARQLEALRDYARARDVGLFGDVPIFVAHDSADVWQRRHLFKLDARGEPTVVAGVPPDYFSRTGQRWGNPLYDGEAMAREGYRFWIERLRVALARCDLLRLDHFIGFTRAWEIPAAEPTAEHGRWVPGPGFALFEALSAALGPRLPLVAEDLGAVTPEVTALRERLGLPGMRVLQFAFGDDPAAPGFLPHAYARGTVAYTGTHDNDTARGWFEDPRVPAAEHDLCLRYLGSDGRDVAWDMIRGVVASVADRAVAPLQDVLGLGSTARMNLPGTASGNWRWRVRAGELTRDRAARLARLARLYGRTGEDPRAAGEPRSLGDYG